MFSFTRLADCCAWSVIVASVHGKRAQAIAGQCLLPIALI